MKRGKFSLSCGFTILELMVSLLIFSLLLGGVYSLLISGNRLWNTDSVKADLQAKARNAMEAMVKELYGSQISLPDVGDSDDEITFQVPDSISAGEIVWSSDIRYAANASNQLARTQSGQADRVIANNVYAVQFDHTDSDRVIIDLTLRKNTILNEPINFTVSQQVTLRN